MKAQRIIEGGEFTRKVDCQSCDKPKEEGEVCEDCGFPQIEIKPTLDGRPLIFLPLCPSTNARMRPVRRGRWAEDILTSDARDYIASVSAELRRMLPEAGVTPITRWKTIELWLILPRTTCDVHNYGKVLFDALESGGLVFNDRYFLPHYRGVWHDSKNPAIIVKA